MCHNIFVVLNFIKLYFKSWTDERLTWGPDAYGGVEKISIPPSYIWTPDFQYMHDRFVCLFVHAMLKCLLEEILTILK